MALVAMSTSRRAMSVVSSERSVGMGQRLDRRRDLRQLGDHVIGDGFGGAIIGLVVDRALFDLLDNGCQLRFKLLKLACGRVLAYVPRESMQTQSAGTSFVRLGSPAWRGRSHASVVLLPLASILSDEPNFQTRRSRAACRAQLVQHRCAPVARRGSAVAWSCRALPGRKSAMDGIVAVLGVPTVRPVKG